MKTFPSSSKMLLSLLVAVSYVCTLELTFTYYMQLMHIVAFVKLTDINNGHI